VSGEIYLVSSNIGFKEKAISNKSHLFETAAQQSVHWTLVMPSAHALGLGDVRSKLTRPICRIFKHFAKRVFGFFLLSIRVHTRPTAGNANR
jgi:hypothetical protein